MSRRRLPLAPRSIPLAALTAIAGLAAVAGLAGCGGSTGLPTVAVGAARVYHLDGFMPGAPVRAGAPTRVSFTVVQPDGRPLTKYRTGSGPHTGIHLIIVRDDLAYIIHRHPPVDASGRLADTVTFPAPGPYRVIIDTYPQSTPTGQASFVMTANITVAGAYRPKPLPPFRAGQTVGGFHFAVTSGAASVHAIQASIIRMRVTDPRGRKVSFTPWYGALAHAIFFHQGSLDYVHTHICAPGAANCGTAIGGASVTGTSSQPGALSIGVLLPVAGTWELFLQAQLGPKVVTVPYTLRVK